MDKVSQVIGPKAEKIAEANPHLGHAQDGWGRRSIGVDLAQGQQKSHLLSRRQLHKTLNMGFLQLF